MADLPFQVVGQPLDELLQAFPNLIFRNWPKNINTANGQQLILHAFVDVGANTYKTILWICADIPNYPERKLEYVLSVPPLVRSILDQVFTLCFLSEDLDNRALLYHKSGWRELWERDQRERQRYGESQKWATVLIENRNLLNALAELTHLSEEEKINPTRHIEYWPLPSRMIKHCLDQSIANYLDFLEDWFYRELSQETHLSHPGLISRAFPLVIDIPPDKLREHLEGRKSVAIVTSITLTIALLSEVQGILRFPGMDEKLKYLWTILQKYWTAPSDLYQKRYQRLLSSLQFQ